MLAVLGLCLGTAGSTGIAQDAPQLQNAARADLGATAKGTGAPFNRDWPAANALGGRGTIFGAPMTGATIDVRTVVPVDVEAVEIVPLDYHLSRLVKAVEISVDGTAKGRFELPNETKPTRIPLQARGQTVTFRVVEEHESRTKDGKTGPNYGGFAALRVWSSTDVEKLMSPLEAYVVAPLPTAIAPTMGSIVEGAVKVAGQPRQAEGHPRTLWDKEDVAHFRRMLGTSATLKQQYEALRRALDDRAMAKLVRAAQDVLTLLAEDGIYMDDLKPDRARPELWRRFAGGERGKGISALGGVRDRSSLALTAGRMRQDTIFRDAAHHFLRQFDRTLQEFEKNCTDHELAELAETRTARAFMLLGRVTGIFD
jgi:hypothetical protein